MHTHPFAQQHTVTEKITYMIYMDMTVRDILGHTHVDAIDSVDIYILLCNLGYEKDIQVNIQGSVIINLGYGTMESLYIPAGVYTSGFTGIRNVRLKS